jgi:hypothetical protein
MAKAMRNGIALTEPLWGGKDSNLRPTDYESGRRPSVEPNRAWRVALSLRSSAEFGGVRDKFRDKVFNSAKGNKSVRSAGRSSRRGHELP